MVADSDQELTHYLHRIKSTWSFILGVEGDLNSRLDANTVRRLQTRCLRYSSEDKAAVTADMDNGILFPNIPDQRTRHRIKVRLEEIGHMIPSLHTLLEDTKYLEPCAKIVKSLLPVKFKGTIREAYEKSHTGLSKFQVQHNEHVFLEREESVRKCIWIAYRQIWLFAMRHFPDMIGICPRKDDGKPKPTVHRPDEILWHKIAQLAGRGGFQTSKIAEYIRRSPFQKMASEFLGQCRPSEYYNISTAVLDRAVGSIVSILQDIEPRVLRFKMPPLTSDYEDNMDLADRCGRPFEQSFLNDKKHLFYESIYDKRSEEWTLEQCERYLTSFKVKHDIFTAFFGNFNEEPEDLSAEDRANNANMMNLQDEDVSSGPSQTPVNTRFTGAPPHSLNTSESTNILAAQTHPSQAPIPAHQNISGGTFHAEEAIDNNRRSEEPIALSIALDEGTSLGTELSTVSPWSIQSTRLEEPSHVEEAGKRRRLNNEEHEEQARPVTTLQVLPKDGIVQTEEIMSNNGQSEALIVTNEGTVPGTESLTVSPSDIQLRRQEEHSHDEYPQKRRRTNSEEFEETSPSKHSTSADSPEVAMLDKHTSGTPSWSEHLTALEAGNGMSPAWEEIPSSRPITMLQLGPSQQQVVPSSGTNQALVVAMNNAPTPTPTETESMLQTLGNLPEIADFDGIVWSPPPLPERDTVHAEEAMGNNGQVSESNVADEGTPPDTQLMSVSPSRRQLQGQEEYSSKRRRVEDTSQHQATDDSDEAMFQAATSAIGNEVVPAQTEGDSVRHLTPLDAALSSGRPETMMQPTSSQQETSYPLDRIPWAMKTSDYIRIHINHSTGKPGSFISIVDVSTGKIDTCDNDFHSYIMWWMRVSKSIQFLAIDPEEKVHCVSADEAFTNATCWDLPLILYETKGHTASLHDRRLINFDSLEYSRRGEPMEEDDDDDEL